MSSDSMGYDDSLCRWTKPSESEAAEWRCDTDEWFVYGTPEQGAAEYATVNVWSKRKDRITRVQLGEEVTHCTFRVSETLEVVYEGDDPDGSMTGGARGFRWHRNEDRHAGASTGTWLVRGEPGRAGSAVIVVNGRTGRKTAVFLTREAGRQHSDSLYEFVRC